MLAVVNAAVERAYAGKREIKWMQVYAGQRAADLYGDNNYLPEETLHALKQLRRIDQGTTNDTHGRRHTLAECFDSPDARSLRLCTTDTLFPGCLDADEGIRPGRHGRFSREHRRHLCRHRVPDRIAGSAETHPLFADGIEGHRDPFPGKFGNRHQTGLPRRFAKTGPQSDSALQSTATSVRLRWFTKATS